MTLERTSAVPLGTACLPHPTGAAWLRYEYVLLALEGVVI